MINKLHLKYWILNIIYPYFHKFTLFCVVLFFSYKAISYTIPEEKIGIAWVIEAIAPEFWEDLRGGEAIAPSDFLTNLNR